jgi:hypothetical protein
VPVEDVDLVSRKKFVVVLLVEANANNSGKVVPILCQSVWQVSSGEKSTPEVERVLVSLVEVQVEKVSTRVVVVNSGVRIRMTEVEVAELKCSFNFFS